MKYVPNSGKSFETTAPTSESPAWKEASGKFSEGFRKAFWLKFPDGVRNKSVPVLLGECAIAYGRGIAAACKRVSIALSERQAPITVGCCIEPKRRY